MNRVLIIKDTANNMALISVLPEKSGRMTVQRRNSQEGLRQTAENDFVFMILNVQPPVSESLEILRQLRTSIVNSTSWVIAKIHEITGDDR